MALTRVCLSMVQVGTLNYMSPEAILGGATNIRGGPPMKVKYSTVSRAQECMPQTLQYRISRRQIPVGYTQSVPIVPASSQACQEIMLLRFSSLSAACFSYASINRQQPRLKGLHWGINTGGPPLGRVEPGVHPVPDGVRAHPLLGAGIHPEDARHHRPGPPRRHAPPPQLSPLRCHPPLPRPQRPHPHLHAGKISHL